MTRKCGATAAVVLGLALTLFASSATAADQAFTWASGAASDDWSAAASWGGTAPSAADGTVDLTFPASACMGVFVQTECPTTTDDIPDLTVGTLSLADITDASSLTGPGLITPGGGSYQVKGDDSLTLDGGIDVPTTALGSGDGSFSEGVTAVDFPIVLGAANAWTLDQHVSLSVNGDVTGNYALSVTGNSDDPVLHAQNFNVGAITFTNTDVNLGAFGSPGEMNSVDGDPVTLTDSDLGGAGATGPLTLNGGVFSIDGLGPFQAASVDLSSTTQVDAGLEATGSAPELTSTGTANLGSSVLSLDDTACLPAGTVTTLVQAGGGIVGAFSDAGGTAITNGEIVQPAYGCSTDSTDPIEINYTADTVTATLDPPSAPASTTTSSTSTSTTPTASVASSTPPPPAVVIPTAEVASLAGGRTEINASLSCSTGTIACPAVSVLATVTEHLKGGKITAISAGAKAKPTTKQAVIATARSVLAAGTTQTVTIDLSSTGLALLKKFGKLSALVTVSSGGTTIDTATVTVQKAATAKKKKTARSV